jgi:hypothetical protein
MVRGTTCKRAAMALAAGLTLGGCTTTVTNVRTISPEEYAAHSWTGHSERDVTAAWGENQRKEPDGTGGYLLTYRKVESRVAAPVATAQGMQDPGSRDDNPAHESQLPQGGSTVDELAKFWIGPDGKVYRFWFADEIYKKGLDAPTARPLEVYGKKKP